MQVAREAEALLNGTHISIACMHGKVALGPQVARLAEGVDLLVGTPGRVQELLDAGALNLDSLRALVLDEADRMLDLGLGAQVMSILAATPPDRQVLLFTATMPPKVAALAESILRQPVRLEIDPSGSIVEHVQQTAYRVEDRDRVELLLHLLRAGRDVALLPATATAPRERRPRASMSDVEDKAVSEPIEDAAWRDGVLVFCRTRRRAHWVGAALQRHGFVVGYLHGDRSHAQRVKALEGFRSRRLQVLLATDVAARGLHVESVRTVLQYDLPLDPAEYVHRVGRASHGLEGRGGKGHAVAFVGRSDLERWTVIAAMSGAPAVLLSPPAAVDIAPGPGAMAAPRQHRRASRATAPRAGDRPATTQSPESGPRAQASGQTRRQRQGRTRDGRPEAGNTRQRRPKIRSSPLKPSQRPGRGARPPGA